MKEARQMTLLKGIKQYTMNSQFKYLLTLAAILTCIYSCDNHSEKDSGKAKNEEVLFQKTKSINWLDTFDIDGDSINDHIYFDYSGGAHCCYKINIVLSSDKKVRNFPFEMDGGYVGGVDNSQPNQFDIRDIDQDGLPEIIMRIQTYNEKSGTIPKNWKDDYGVISNFIVIEYIGGQIKIGDYKPK
jgi:hypothetical protein